LGVDGDEAQPDINIASNSSTLDKQIKIDSDEIALMIITFISNLI
jgi:hypothetical protein